MQSSKSCCIFHSLWIVILKIFKLLLAKFDDLVLSDESHVLINADNFSSMFSVEWYRKFRINDKLIFRILGKLSLMLKMSYMSANIVLNEKKLFIIQAILKSLLKVSSISIDCVWWEDCWINKTFIYLFVLSIFRKTREY